MARYEAFRLCVLLHEQHLGERDPLDLGRVDALVGGVDQAQRLLDAEQHDLGVGERFLQDGAERDRAALALERQVASIGVPHGVRHRLEAGPFRRAVEGLAVGLSLELELDVPRRNRLEMLDQLRLRVLRIHAGRDSEVDPGAGLVGHGRRRADDGRAVDAEHGGGRSRPEHVGDVVAEQVHAVEHVRVLAELLGGIRRARPLLRPVEPADRRVALLVAHGVEHADQGRERVRCGAAEHARVHGTSSVRTVTQTSGHPAQARGEGRHADRDVARVADEDRVRAEQVGVLRNERLETAGALLLGALADDLDGHGRLVPERAEGGQVRGHAALAVGGAAPVPATVSLGQLPGRRLPVLVRRRLDVVMEVEEDRRRSRRPRDLAGDGLAAVRRLVGADVLDADAREGVDGPVDHPLALRRARCRRRPT